MTAETPQTDADFADEVEATNSPSAKRIEELEHAWSNIMITNALPPVAVIRAYGMPKGQPRPRAFSRGGHASVYDPGTAEGWKSSIAQAAVNIRGARHTCPLMLQLVFWMPRPKSHFTSKGALKPSAPLWFSKKPDADNMAKAVMDALTTLAVWHDDDQVVVLCVTKKYATENDQPGALITIAPLPADGRAAL